MTVPLYCLEYLTAEVIAMNFLPGTTDHRVSVGGVRKDQVHRVPPDSS